MRIKGTSTDEAVLCTSDKTYTLRLAESSNSLLLAPNKKKRSLEDTLDLASDTTATANDPLQVQASSGAYFELLRSAPRTGGLLALLTSWPHGSSSAIASAPEEGEAVAEGGSEEPEKRRLTLAELETAVQSSAAELRRALQEARALEIGGGWCVLDAQLEMDILECILSLCVEHSWPLTAVPTAQCVELMRNEFPAFDEMSIRHCMRTHSVHAAAAWDEWLAAADLETISLGDEAISRFRARALLAEADSWPRDKFFEAWAEALPAGHTADPAHLAGLAITLSPPTGSEEEPRLQGLPISALSSIPKERFKALFAIKRSWSLDELTPYIKELLDPGVSATKLVLLHARSVTANDGTVTYVAR